MEKTDEPKSISSSSLLPSSYSSHHEVFLNFKADDSVLNNVVTPLSNSLEKWGIRISIDKINLHNNNNNDGQLSFGKVIESSKFAIIIFSKNYASSIWCLDELVKIMECNNKFGLIIMPIFYEIKPSDVFDQRNSFSVAFTNHELFLKDIDRVVRWREALREVSNMFGQDIGRWTGRSCVENIVEEISKKLRPKALPSIVGTTSHLVEVIKFLDTEPNEVRFIGILETNGWAASHVAAGLLRKWDDQFDVTIYITCFSHRKSDTIESLQESLVSKVLRSVERKHISDISISDVDEGCKMIKNLLQSRRVLVIMHDVDDITRFKALAGECDWFGPGSRIIITSKDEHLLNEVVHDTYKVDLLSKSETKLCYSYYYSADDDDDDDDDDELHFQLSILNWTGGPKKEEVDATTTTFRSEINVEKLVVKYTLEIMNFLHILPTTYRISRNELVLLWAAVGLIEAESDEELERIGFSCLDHLENFTYRVMKNSPSSLDPRCARRLDKINHSYLSRLEHLSLFLVGKNDSSIIRLQSCCRLKTLILRGKLGTLPSDVFLGLGELRALDVRGTNLWCLPNSFEKLELLKYLDISKTPIRSLKLFSIVHVTKLETLIFSRRSEYSDELPDYLSKLINLRHLEFEDCYDIRSLPRGFGNLTKLLSLEVFPVGNEDRARLGELMNMNDLKGSISITQLDNVLSEEDAKRASLHMKKNITKLSLDWEYSKTKGTSINEKVLEYLRPHFSLEELTIVGYNGEVLPSWISSPDFSAIVSIFLINCNFCACLSSFGQLSSLKSLYISGMNGVSNINGLFCRKSPTNNDYHAFPKLEKLNLSGMSNLESWTGVEEGDFPSLLMLTISHCGRLVTLPTLSSIKSLKEIYLYDCPVLSRRLIDDLPCNLEEFEVTDCPTLKERSHRNVSRFRLPQHPDEIYVDYDRVQVD